MKKHLYLILIAALTISQVSSCTKENPTSGIRFEPVSDEQITVGPEAATHVLGYEITNPTGSSVSAEINPDVDWITEVNTTSAYGEVYVSVSVNDGSESRTAGITLVYEGLRIEYTLVQQPYSAFSIIVRENECTTGKIVWNVVPPTVDLTYVSMAVEKEVWDSYSSYSEYMEYDMDYFKKEAEDINLSLEEFLTKYVLKQGEGTYSAESLSADTEYVVYAYGMDTSGNVLTGIYYAEARTLPVESQEVTFELSVSQNPDDWNLTISAVPSDDGVRYLMDVYNGTNTPEAITASYQVMLDEIITLLPLLGGGTVYDYFMDVSYQGVATSSPIDYPSVFEFTAFAVAVDVYTGQLTSIASTQVCELDFGF